jgi:biotin transport system substrate-specific component
VPVTLQTFVVVLAGMWLGPVAGAASMLLYLAAGAAGLPVFAPIGAPGIARLVGPTGGYLLAYPVAAYVAGFIAQRVPRIEGRVVAALVGVAVILAGGITQLAVITGDAGRAMQMGVTPFALLDVVKAFAAAALTERGARTRTSA